MSGLRIAFFGSSLVSAYWNGAATYYRGIIRALAARGHQVTFYEPDIYERQEHRDIEDPPWAKVVVYRPELREMWRALKSASDVDLLIKTSGVGVFDDVLEAAILDVRSPHTTVAFWDVDAPATLDRIAKDPTDPFRALIPQYALILTYGGGDPVVNTYAELGARYCVPIYNALDAHTHFPAEPDPRFVSDLNLLANRLPDREHRVEEFFFRAARNAPELNFKLGGNGWESKQMPGNVNRTGHVFTRDHNAFNCSARAVLNVNRENMATYGFSPPTRIFEAAGAGACIITDAWEGIEMFLAPGHEVLVAKDGLEVVGHVRSLTAARARALGNAAYKRVLAEHTYEHRANQLECILAVHTKIASTRTVSGPPTSRTSSAATSSSTR